MDSSLACNHMSDYQNQSTASQESDLLITCMITDQIGQHEILLPIIHKYNKIFNIIGSFQIKTQEILSYFFASSEKKPFKYVWWHVLYNYLGMMHTVLLHCPISAELRTVDSQSDLRILLQLWLM